MLLIPADFPWQTQWMVREKATALCTRYSPCSSAWPSWELLAHCSIDAIKAQSKDPRFWTLLGLDQWAHHMTYVSIALYLRASWT